MGFILRPVQFMDEFDDEMPQAAKNNKSSDILLGIFRSFRTRTLKERIYNLKIMRSRSKKIFLMKISLNYNCRGL